jgi:hypothetical protein
MLKKIHGFFQRKHKKQDLNFSLEHPEGMVKDSEGIKTAGEPASSLSAPFILKEMNMVPFDWTGSIVRDITVHKVLGEILKKVFLFIILCGLIVSMFIGTTLWKSSHKRRITACISGINSTLRDYEAIMDNFASYKAYIAIPNTPPLYTQFYGIAHLLLSHGFLVRDITFETSPLGSARNIVNSDTFALETGKDMKNTNVCGIWSISGIFSTPGKNVPDSNWTLNFNKSISSLMETQHIHAYTRVANARNDSYASSRPLTTENNNNITITILLWQ